MNDDKILILSLAISVPFRPFSTTEALSFPRSLSHVLQSVLFFTRARYGFCFKYINCGSIPTRSGSFFPSVPSTDQRWCPQKLRPSVVAPCPAPPSGSEEHELQNTQSHFNRSTQENIACKEQGNRETRTRRDRS